MGLFSRKKKTVDDSAIPEEIRDYYQAEKRDRMWVVWLLSGATFLVTVFVVLGIFWGGRWIYRQVANDDKPATVSTQDDQGENKNTESSNESDQNDQSAQDQPESNSPSDSSTATNQPAPTPSPQPAPTPTPTAQAPSSTPQTGDTAAELPRTGPTSDE